METQTFKISRTNSNIDWIGRKVTGAHNGTIGIKHGSLTFENDQLASGLFVIDVKSIKILDISDPDTNAQFASHLASDDFFNTEQFPESTLEITNAEPRGDGTYHINALLTIKGILHPVSFNAKIERTSDHVRATGNITIDRTKYGIKFRSGNFFKDLGDNLIYNNFDLHVNLIGEVVKNHVAL